MRIFAFAFAFAHPIACVVNDNSRQDTYMNAYMEFQSTSELPLGVVYPESAHTYGPPQPRPLPPPYYGAPAPYPPSPPLPHIYPAEPHFPLLETMLHLPSKLEFVPKLITAFLEITKILLKVVLLKIVLKFVVMFCLFFFLPKLDMLDMMTDMSTKPSQSMATVATAASNNSTVAADTSSEGMMMA